MNDCTDQTSPRRHAAAIGIRENEHATLHHQYGRRIEADTSWSVYHVFSGVPAEIEGCSLTGLSRSDATDRMMALNRRNERRRQRSALTENPGPREIGGIRS